MYVRKNIFCTLTLYPKKSSIDTSDIHPTFYQHGSAMRNTADVSGVKSISGVYAVNPLVAGYDIYERKEEVLFFCFVPDTTRDTRYFSYK
jgi:hypothetical protein